MHSVTLFIDTFFIGPESCNASRHPSNLDLRCEVLSQSRSIWLSKSIDTDVVFQTVFSLQRNKRVWVRCCVMAVFDWIISVMIQSDSFFFLSDSLHCWSDPKDQQRNWHQLQLKQFVGCQTHTLPLLPVLLAPSWCLLCLILPEGFGSFSWWVIVTTSKCWSDRCLGWLRFSLFILSSSLLCPEVISFSPSLVAVTPIPIDLVQHWSVAWGTQYCWTKEQKRVKYVTVRRDYLFS